MNGQEKTGWTIVAIILLLLWWLSKNGLLHGASGGSGGYTTSVQSGIVGGPMNEATITEYSGGQAPTPCCG
jgi:hypothetical protein